MKCRELPSASVSRYRVSASNKPDLFALHRVAAMEVVRSLSAAYGLNFESLCHARYAVLGRCSILSGRFESALPCSA
jgi:hypothetical protein